MASSRMPSDFLSAPLDRRPLHKKGKVLNIRFSADDN